MPSHERVLLLAAGRKDYGGMEQTGAPPPAESRLLVSFQYVPIQLAGGAPWGFTLQGGLEHGEPLVVSKVEDGGKASLSQKMRPGDELVNINGTPLYGSRQEALILIKGSYRTLKMIIRSWDLQGDGALWACKQPLPVVSSLQEDRRNVPTLRPHSWHLAKLSEGRTEPATTMLCHPADAFSLSWHSGCDASDLPLPWNPLSHCCSTDKSSSFGSMESLDQPSQSSSYEGRLSPLDQAMCQSKRDSAYSSFSASSNTSDSALRPDETNSTECLQHGQLPEPRYLQTGSESAEAPSPSSAPCTQEIQLSRSAKAPAPPQPPVRQDSLRAHRPTPVSPEADSSIALVTDSLHPEGRWTSDTSLCVHGRDSDGSSVQSASGGHSTEPLATDQYYLLSSHTDRHTPMEEGAQSMAHRLLEEEEERDAGTSRDDSKGHEAQSLWKECGSGGHVAVHRHSTPEQLLATQMQALSGGPGYEGPHWTVSPLHVEQKSPRASESFQHQDCSHPSSPHQAREQDFCFAVGAELHAAGGRGGGGTGSDRPPCAAGAEQLTPSPPLQPSPGKNTGFTLTARPDTSSMESRPVVRKAGSAQPRSTQIRRRSDRFATHLRNEIQWRKAQLQKAKDSSVLLCGQEPVQEGEEPPESPPAPPPPSVNGGPHRSAPLKTGLPPCWRAESSVAGGGSRGSPAPEPKWKDPVPEPERPPKGPRAPMLGGGGRWTWSPEHKLQPHRQSQPQAADPELSEESGLLPFADRRRFFEETSKPLPSAHLAPGAGSRLRAAEQDTFQPVCLERKGQRRHSVDQAYTPLPSSSPPAYPDFPFEGPGRYRPLAGPGDSECWRGPLPCSCVYCSGGRCPVLLPRNVSVPPSHCAHHCHPRPWTHCGDCCCPAQHKLLEERPPWHARRTCQLAFPVEEWEPPAISRRKSQSMSELVQHKMGFARAGPFRPCFETMEPEWIPFCRAVSTHNLPWDCERPSTPAESLPSKERPREPRQPPPPLLLLRERAYSESHLGAEPASTSRRVERQGAPGLAKLEEARLELPPGAAKKRGPPPPRPPPPNWEQYCFRRASHHQLLPTEAGWSPAPGQSSTEVARQRSHSLPLDQLWNDTARLASSRRQESPSPPAPCHGSPGKGLKWTGADPSSSSSSSPRPASCLEEEAKPEPLWDREEGGFSRITSEPPQAMPHRSLSPEDGSSQEGTEEESWQPGPKPPLRLTSEELLRDVAGRDQSLAGVLSPASGRVTVAEVMGDLFSPSESCRWQSQEGGERLLERPQTPPISPTFGGAASPTSCSAYYNMSAGKAQLLSKIKDLPETAGASPEEEEQERDLARKKVQLIESISRKLAVLQEAQQGLQDDIRANVSLGKEVENHVKGVCKAHELEKFRLFVGDLDKVINLLLSLSGRLARVENAISGLDSEAPEEEKLALVEKQRQLTAQLEDAKELQEHVAQRERLVFASVSRCLPSEQLQDYQHFVRMTSALAVQQRQLEDKMKLGEEQLRCLRDSLHRVPRPY